MHSTWILQKGKTAMNACKGFTLIEIIIVIAIVGILIGGSLPLVFQQLESSRISATKGEMTKIHRAIVGDSEKGTFGYAGDMSRLPASNAGTSTVFDELITQGALPAFGTTTNSNGLKWGWNGPYVNVGYGGSDELKKDAWGNFYDYGQVHDPGADGVLGTGDDVTSNTGIIRSAGPDGVYASSLAIRAGTADDIIYPNRAVDITSDVVVEVLLKKTHIHEQEPPATVTVYYLDPSTGLETSQSDSASPYLFTGIPVGLRAIKVDTGTTKSFNVSIPGGGRTAHVRLTRETP